MPSPPPMSATSSTSTGSIDLGCLLRHLLPARRPPKLRSPSPTGLLLFPLATLELDRRSGLDSRLPHPPPHPCRSASLAFTRSNLGWINFRFSILCFGLPTKVLVEIYVVVSFYFNLVNFFIQFYVVDLWYYLFEIVVLSDLGGAKMMSKSTLWLLSVITIALLAAAEGRTLDGGQDLEAE